MNATVNEPLEFFRSMYPHLPHEESNAKLAAAEAWKDARIAEGTLRVQWKYDTDFEVEGSIAYGDTPEDQAAEAEYYRKANEGLIEFLGCVVETKCDKCGQWQHAQSLWGISLDNSTDGSRQQGRNYQRLVEAELCLEIME